MRIPSSPSSSSSAATAKSRLNGAKHPETPRAKVKPTMSSENAQRIHDDLRAQARQFSADWDACSAQRKLAAWALALSAAVGAAMAGGEVLGYLVVGAMAMSGSTFLAMLAYAIGLVLAINATVTAFSTTFSYVVSSRCTQHMALIAEGAAAATDKVRGWFGVREEVTA